MTGRNSLKAFAVLSALMCGSAPLASAEPPSTYEASWESIDQHPMPQWWVDAKFGIFIHWGVYSVPSFSPLGTYAEWYWERMNAHGAGPEGDPRNHMRDSEQVRAFHDQVYGPEVDYPEFADDFTAEMFDPEEWAKLFERSGAKYVVLTSKHHDGFALWPSADADASWGRPWNAVSAGPKRDVLGDLTEAVRAEGLKMGYYFSLYEWYNPLYREDPKRYAVEHMAPQFKDLIERYDPAILFGDGEWHMPSEDWNSPELLSWVLNRPETRDVVLNDRWGKDTRHAHGDYYTTEYGAGMPDAAYPWEESRGMGTSYGYNRNESIDDYNTSEELVLTLLDTVSRGGNLLLNVGPTSDGRIPVIMQQRLADIGAWLDVNGEAIYGTSPWKVAAQWTEGEVWEFTAKAHGRVPYDIIKLTLTPDEGKARKEIVFTHKDDTLFAIMPKYPRDSILIKNVTLSKDSEVSLLGLDASPLDWSAEGDGIRIQIPALLPGDMPLDVAFTLKITGVEG